MNKYTNESIDAKLKECLPHITRLGTYKGIKEPLLVECSCNYTYSPSLDNLNRAIRLGTKACPFCSGKLKHTNLSIDNLLNNTTLTRVSSYKGNRATPLDILCVCGYERTTSLASILNSKRNNTPGCPSCSKTKVLTEEEYLSKIKNLKLLEAYTFSTVKTLHQCTVCFHKWGVFPYNTLQGHGCPKCAIKINALANTKTHSTYAAEAIAFGVEVLEPYRGDAIKIKHKHILCGHEWEVVPTSILQGKSCPSCALVVAQISWEGKRGTALKEKALKIPCTLYILKSKDCIKLGITRNLINRLKKLPGFEIHKEYDLNVWNATHIEQKTLNRFKRYIAPTKFPGYTELRHTEDILTIEHYITKELEQC